MKKMLAKLPTLDLRPDIVTFVKLLVVFRRNALPMNIYLFTHLFRITQHTYRSLVRSCMVVIFTSRSDSSIAVGTFPLTRML